MMRILTALAALGLAAPAAAQWDEYAEIHGAGAIVDAEAQVAVTGPVAGVAMLQMSCGACSATALPPGLALGLDGAGHAAVDRSGIGEGVIVSALPVTFDTSKVVTVRWWVKLGRTDGHIKVWFDGVLALDAPGATIADPAAMADSGVRLVANGYDTVAGVAGQALAGAVSVVVLPPP